LPAARSNAGGAKKKSTLLSPGGKAKENQSIRIMCRFRPQLPHEKGNMCVTFPYEAGGKAVVINDKEKKRDLMFDFHRVFPPDSKQISIYRFPLIFRKARCIAFFFFLLLLLLPSF
jgi:hypothetical protein